MKNKNLENYHNIIIFGAGEGHILKWLIYKYKSQIRLIIDNDSKKWGKYKSGILIDSSNKIKDYNKEDTVVIVSLYNHIDEIRKQISGLGWGENIIIAKEDMKEFNSFEFNLFKKNLTVENFYPQICNIELSSICNCRCIYCPFHGVQNLKKGQKGLMNWDTLEKVVEQLKQIPTFNKISTVGAGEIFIHPEWYEMVQYVLNETKIKTLNMYTNGMLLNKENVNKLLQLDIEEIEFEVSIDGRTAKDNDYYRIGSKYEEIKENIYYLLNEKEKIGRNIKITITNCYPVREEELEYINREYESLHVNVPQYLKIDFPNVNIISKCTYINKRKNNMDNFGNLKMFEVSIPTNCHKKCTDLFSRMAINYKGELLRCSCGHAGIEGIGNVNECNILELWKNDSEMNRAREHFIKDNITTDMCEGCPRRGMGNYYIMVE